MTEAELINPGSEDWESHYNNALALYQEGEADMAALHLQMVIEAHPHHPGPHKLLIQCLLMIDQADAALEQLEGDSRPYLEEDDLHFWQGMCQFKLQELEAARHNFEAALQLSPDYPFAEFKLAEILVQQGDKTAALGHLERYCGLYPGDLDALLMRAELLTSLKRPQEALPLYRTAYLRNPQNTEALNRWLAVQMQMHMVEKANHAPAEIMKGIIELAKSNPQLKNDLAIKSAYIFEYLDEIDEVRKCLSMALEDPDLADSAGYTMRFALLHELLPKSQQQLKRNTHFLIKGVQKLHQMRPEEPLVTKDLSNIQVYLDAACALSTLPYHNIDPLPLRKQMGEIMQALLPPFEPPSPPVRERPRLVFLLNSNSSTEAFLLHAFRYFPADKAEMVLVYLPDDTLRGRLQQLCPQFRHISLPQDPKAHLELLHDLAPDLLFLSEVYTDRPAQTLLSFYRFAPVQVTSWLSSGSTGSVHMDAFISSRLIEQESNPQRFYTETLHLIDDIPGVMKRPVRLAERPARSEYGLPEQGALYVCPHLLFKLHPDFDHVLAGILNQDPTGHVVIQQRPDTPSILNRFLARIEALYPEVMTRIWVLPMMQHSDYLGLLQIADVMLDPFYFGGGTSSYEALAMNLPVVTWPGERLHGRITLGYYNQMQCLDCVAYNPENYVDLAVRLGNDAHFAALVRERIAARVDVLFDRQHAAEALFECLLKLAQEKMQPPPEAEPESDEPASDDVASDGRESEGADAEGHAEGTGAP